MLGSDHSYQEDEDYRYDGNGNRVNTGYETGENNRLLSDGTYTYEYDPEGNRTKRVEVVTGEVTEYVWDFRNRLIKMETKDDTGVVIKSVEYSYDAYNRRIEKSVDSDGDGAEQAGIERFVYDGDHIALVFDGEGNQTARYLHGDYIDQVLAEESADGQVRWALADNQGTVRDVIDSDGIVLNHISYDSFGNVTAETNPDVDSRFRYTGREFDEETGQYYYRARYFDQGVGRFVSEDPIGFSAGDANSYRYVSNSSPNYKDPSGLFLFSMPGEGPDVGGSVSALFAATKDYVVDKAEDAINAIKNRISTRRNESLESNNINRGKAFPSPLKDIPPIGGFGIPREPLGGFDAGGGSNFSDWNESFPTKPLWDIYKDCFDINDGDAWDELDRLNDPTFGVSEKARKIANHTWNAGTNKGQFLVDGITTPGQLAQKVDNIMTDPFRAESGNRDRTAYEGQDNRTIVIDDPISFDGGTVFKPDNIEEFWDKFN